MTMSPEELEEEVRNLKISVEDLLENLESPDDADEDASYLPMEVTTGERQTIVHWIELPITAGGTTYSSAADVVTFADAEAIFLKAAQDRDEHNASATHDRSVSHGDLMVLGSRPDTWICYVAQVDRYDTDPRWGFQLEDPTAGLLALTETLGTGSHANREFIIWGVGAGKAACCTPKYSELKFTATPDDGTSSPSLRTWDCLQWDGSQYIGMNTDTTAPGDYSLQVFYDRCGRGWTAIIEPTNTQSILGTLTASSGANNMTSIGAAGGTYVYTGGGPIMYGDSASRVATIISFDTHPCDVDLVNMENQLLDGDDVSGLVNVSATMRIYACD